MLTKSMAVQHIVWIKFKPQIGQDRINAHLDALSTLKDDIPGILALALGKNFTQRADGYTHCLTVTLADKAALAQYAAHPHHLSIAAALEQDSDYLVFDYEQ